MEKEAVDTTSLLFMAKLKRFDLLKNIFKKVLITKQIKEEIFKKKQPENVIIEKELGNFIHETNVKEIKDFSLHIGEKSAISLCLERNIKYFISDDKKARKFARSLDIETIGIAGIILANLQNNKITNKEAKELVDELIKNKYYISTNLYSELMEKLKW